MGKETARSTANPSHWQPGQERFQPPDHPRSALRAEGALQRSRLMGRPSG